MEENELETRDPRIQAFIEVCMKACVEAEEILGEQGDYSRIAQLARKVMLQCELLFKLGIGEAEIYGATNRISESVYEHPRLVLELKKTGLRAVEQLEKKENDEYEEGTALRKEIAQLESNIKAADEGRFGDIQTDSVLKRDPVEWTKAFEDVVDEVEHEVYEKLIDIPRGMGFCFAYWAARREAFQKRGIEWRSPHQMNPRVMFD